nr:hypothetical protein [Tanacetum cinerariifolium]
MSIEIRKKEKLLQQEQWAYLSTHPSKLLTFYCDDDDDDYDSAITPILSTEEPIDSLSMWDEHLDTISATESDEVIKSSVEDLDFSESNNEVSSIDDDSFSIDNINYVEASPLDVELVSFEVMEIVIPEVGGIDDDIPLTIKDDNLREKLSNVNLLIATIEALNDNPTPSSDCKTKSSSTSLDSLLEETITFHNSLPKFENFYFDLGEISSGSTTTHSDISLPDYEAFSFDDDHIKEISSGSTTTHSDISLPDYEAFSFDDDHIKEISSGKISSGITTTHSDISIPEYEAFYDDHVKEINSGSPTTHSDSPLYDSFIFDLAINAFPPADRSDFYEFADEFIYFISPPEYDCFLFKIEPNSGDFTMDVVEDISPTKESKVQNDLPTYPNLQLNLKLQPS